MSPYMLKVVYRNCFIEANTLFIQKKEHFIFQLFTMNFETRMICFLKEKISHKKGCKPKKKKVAFC